MSSPPSSPCCHQETVVSILFVGALSPASRSSHSLVAVRFIALLRIGRNSYQFFVVILVQRVIFIFAYIDVVIVVVVITTSCGIIVVVSVVDY